MYTPFRIVKQEWGEWKAENGDLIRFLIVLRRVADDHEHQRLRIDADQHFVVWPVSLESPPEVPPTDDEIEAATGEHVTFEELFPAVSEYRLDSGVTLKFVAHLDHLIDSQLVSRDGEPLYKGEFKISPEGMRHADVRPGRRRRR